VGQEMAGDIGVYGLEVRAAENLSLTQHICNSRGTFGNWDRSLRGNEIAVVHEHSERKCA
jgi:hypothetical protein